MTRRRQAGVSILEVIIALAVIAIALLQAVSLVTHTATMKEVTKEQMIAKESCTAKLEEIKAKLKGHKTVKDVDEKTGTITVEL